MKAHTKIYLDYFEYTPDEFIPCEVCNSKAVDIHHIECRGMGGSKLKNDIKNLMAVCRECHIKYGDKKKYIEMLEIIHHRKLTQANEYRAD
jgi:hypothetical protein